MGPSTTGTGEAVGLGSSEGVAVCVIVGIRTVEVGRYTVGVCVSREKDEGILVPSGVARAIPGVIEETVCEGVVISSSAEGCVLFTVDNVQAHKESPASTHKLIVILARIYFGLPMSLWAETVYEKVGRWLFR